MRKVTFAGVERWDSDRPLGSGKRTLVASMVVRWVSLGVLEPFVQPTYALDRDL